MARIFDVVEYRSEMEDEIAHRIPEEGVADLRLGSQVIVQPSQVAVFIRGGQALDYFGPGTHTITTYNIPKLIDFIGKAFNDRTPFTAEIFFVSMKEFVNRKWGTPQPIIIRNPGVGLGWTLLQGFGSYGFKVKDPLQFITQVVGAPEGGIYRISSMEDRLRSMMLQRLQDLLAETAATKDIGSLIGLTNELAAGVRAKLQDDFAAMGLTLIAFYISNLKPSEKSAEELRAMGILDMATYTQLQAADAMREAARNPAGGAGLTAGIGAGIGLGNIISQSVQGISAGQQAGQAAAAGAVAGGAAAGAAAGGAMQAVMTPSEAAAALRVSEEDVIAAIQSGDLKAKKIGNAYRISKESLEAFLKG
jgi:excisionase family DNA binding protein